MQTITLQRTPPMKGEWKWAAGGCASMPCPLLSTPVSSSVSDRHTEGVCVCVPFFVRQSSRHPLARPCPAVTALAAV